MTCSLLVLNYKKNSIFVFIKKTEILKNLVLQPTETTPYVNFDVQNRLFEISGRSIPANAEELFFEIKKSTNASIPTELVKAPKE